MKLTPEEKAGLSPAEIEALEGTGADEALATMGENKPAATQAAAADENDDAADDKGDDDATEGDDDAADEGKADATALTAEQLAAIAQDAEQQPAAAALPKFDVPERDFAAERKALRDSRKAIQAKWDEGEIDDAALQAQMEAVDDQLEALATERATADTLRSINEKAAADAKAAIDDAYNVATTAIIKAAAESTTAKVDYLKDKTAQAQFDMALDMLQADPANAAKKPADLVQQAHRAVLVIRGLPLGDPKPTPTPTTTAQPKPRDVPMSLAHVPNAGTVPLQDETLAQASQLSGDELEAYMARLSPQQLKKLMGTVDRQSGATH